MHHENKDIESNDYGSSMKVVEMQQFTPVRPGVMNIISRFGIDA